MIFCAVLGLLFAPDVVVPWQPLLLDEPRWRVAASVGGRPFELVLDSGSPITIVDSLPVGDIGVTIPDDAGTVDGADAQARRVPLLALAGAGFTNAKVYVAPGLVGTGQFLELGVEGALGYDVLRNCALAVDFDAGKLALAVDPRPEEAMNLLFAGKPEAALTRIPIIDDAKRSRPYVDVSFGGTRRRMILDLGARDSCLETPIAGSAGWPLLAEDEITSSSGPVPEAVRLAPSASVGPFSVSDAIFGVFRRPTHDEDDILSWTFFAPAGKVLFDFRHRVVVLESKTSTGIACRLANMGLAFDSGGVRIRPGTVATHVGLSPSDRVESIGGVSVGTELSGVLAGPIERRIAFLRSTNTGTDVTVTRAGELKRVSVPPSEEAAGHSQARLGVEIVKLDSVKAGEVTDSDLYVMPGAGIVRLPPNADAALRAHGFVLLPAVAAPVLKPGAVRLDGSDGSKRTLGAGVSDRFRLVAPGRWAIFVRRGTAMPIVHVEGGAGAEFVTVSVAPNGK